MWVGYWVVDDANCTDVGRGCGFGRGVFCLRFDLNAHKLRCATKLPAAGGFGESREE